MQRQIDTEQIKQANDCRLVAERYTTLTRATATESAGPCPFCRDGDDRFRVWASGYWCRQCNRKGDVITLVVELEHLSFVEACKLLSVGALPTTAAPLRPTKAAQAPKDWDERYWLDQVKNGHKAIIETTGKKIQRARDYLIGRGLTVPTVQAYRLGYAEMPVPLPPPDDLIAPAIMLPWFERSGALTAIKYRFLETHEHVNAKGETKKAKQTSRGNFAGHVFGWQTVKGPARNRILIISEGEINAISLWQASEGVCDVLSPGTESMMKTIPDDLVEFAGQYAYRIVWVDKPELARQVHTRIKADFSMSSPDNRDANTFLPTDELGEIIDYILTKIGAHIPVKPEPEHESAQPDEQASRGEALQQDHVG